MPKGKKQHYVPQFYLRLFSQDKDSIRLYNINQKKFFIAPIKNVCYESYYYDKDGKIEDALAKLEEIASNIIYSIIKNNNINHIKEEDYFHLLNFILAQHSRTKSMGDATIELVNKLFDKVKPKSIKDVKLTSDHPTLDSLSASLLSAPLILDLKPILLINNTKKDFITSDNPAILFNSFFNDKIDGGTTGFNQTGLQIFYPISQKLLLLLYDNDFYKIIGENNSTLIIKKEEDVRRMNGLQILHCDEDIYYLNLDIANDLKLQHRQIGFKRPKQKIELETIGIRKEEGKTHELIRNSSTKIKYNLDKLSFMKNKNNVDKEFGLRNEGLLEQHKKFVEDLIKEKVRERETNKNKEK